MNYEVSKDYDATIKESQVNTSYSVESLSKNDIYFASSIKQHLPFPKHILVSLQNSFVLKRRSMVLFVCEMTHVTFHKGKRKGARSGSTEIITIIQSYNLSPPKAADERHMINNTLYIRPCPSS